MRSHVNDAERWVKVLRQRRRRRWSGLKCQIAADKIFRLSMDAGEICPRKCLDLKHSVHLAVRRVVFDGRSRLPARRAISPLPRAAVCEHSTASPSRRGRSAEASYCACRFLWLRTRLSARCRPSSAAVVVCDAPHHLPFLQRSRPLCALNLPNPSRPCHSRHNSTDSISAYCAAERGS